MLVENASGDPKPNTRIVLSLRHAFAIFKKLSIDGLLAQVACHVLLTLDQDAFEQLVMAAIFLKGDEKQCLAFVWKVIINASQLQEGQTQVPSPFVYGVSESQPLTWFFPKPAMTHNPCPMLTQADICQPPDHLVDRFGASCFHCGRPGHWRDDCPHTRGMATPHPRSPLPTPFPWREPLPLTGVLNKTRVRTINGRGYLKYILLNMGGPTRS
ncbi:hypothetical protein O181_045901 [Austropuccinia psidii MF-1]|uniref:CCHC-type domain-containing protein n=1 Tax=Austropuccinia psidii MF-1 TaxID=1389203 RepID=A0A9Q3HI54_9BASI|nr:hypothetical protein [Austropuccinia psidii MF-1]